LAAALPHHAGPEAGVLEGIDQTCGVVAPGHSVEHGLAQREVLDALGGPVSADLVARDAPDLLGVCAEEVIEQPLAEAVDHPLLEGLLDPVGPGPPAAVAGEHEP